MTEEEVHNAAFAMPFTNPAYPPGPYRFVDREYLKQLGLQPQGLF